MSFVKLAAGDMYYEEHGSGDAVLVWIHGFAGSGRMFAELLPAFRSYRSILVDLPGFGRSSAAGGRCLVPELSAATHAVIAELGIERYTPIGVSMGGGVALRLALDHPAEVASMIAVVALPAAGVPRDPRSDEMRAQYAKLYRNRDGLRAGFCAVCVGEPPAAIEALVDDAMSVNETTWLDWTTGESPHWNQADELGGVAVPCCYILGGKDITVTLESQLATVRAIPGARAVVLNDEGHLLSLENPARLAAEIEFSLRSA